MVERTLLVRLKDEFTGESTRLEVAGHSRNTLRRIPGAREVVVAAPADERSGKDWDLAIRVRLDSSGALERFTSDPAYQAYAEQYLGPRALVVKAWNFRPIE
jgi:hypothetical protein